MMKKIEFRCLSMGSVKNALRYAECYIESKARGGIKDGEHRNLRTSMLLGGHARLGENTTSPVYAIYETKTKIVVSEIVKNEKGENVCL